MGPGPSFIRWGQVVEFTPDDRYAQYAHRIVSRPNPLWERIVSEIAGGYADDWNRAVVKKFNGWSGIVKLGVNDSEIFFRAEGIVRRDYGDAPSLRVGSAVWVKLAGPPSRRGFKPDASRVVDLEENAPPAR